MSVQFTCRLAVVPAADGLVRVQYGPIDRQGASIISFDGPAAVIPPDRDLTDAELVEWIQGRIDAGFATQGASPITEKNPLSSDAFVAMTLIEAMRTIEEEIPHGSVHCELHWLPINDDTRKLVVRVSNEWDRAIPKFGLALACRLDADQPVEFDGVGCQMVDGSMRLEPANDITKETPHLFPASQVPGISYAYSLCHDALASLKSWAASKSTDCFWFALLTAGNEFGRVDGSRISAFLDRSDAG